MKCKIIELVLCLLLCNSVAIAQEFYADTFKLEKKSGHYIFNASINNKVDASFLLESGIHVMLIDSLFAFDNRESLGVELIKNAAQDKMNLGGRVYNITHKANGTIKISNNTTYEGEIYVLANYKSYFDIAIPIQRLCNNIDRSHIVKLDLVNNRLEISNRTSCKKITKGYSTQAINYNSYLKMPAVKTTINIYQAGKRRVLNGNFNLDLGNAALLFLFQQSVTAQQFLTNNSDIELQQAFNRKGIPIAKAMEADSCKLCSVEFTKPIIAITNSLPRFTTDGNIGLKFFENCTAIFDFDKSKLYIKDVRGK